MKVKRNFMIVVAVILLSVPALNTSGTNNFINNSSTVAYADVTLSSLPKDKIMAILKKGVHPANMALPHITKHGNSIIVAYNTGANAGGKAMLTQHGKYVHIHVQPYQSKGTAGPGGQTLKPTKNLTAAGIHKTDANVMVAGLSSNPSKSPKSPRFSPKSKPVTHSHQNTTRPKSPKPVNSTGSTNNQTNVQQHNQAIRKASTASVATFVILLILYIIKRIFNRSNHR